MSNDRLKLNRSVLNHKESFKYDCNLLTFCGSPPSFLEEFPSPSPWVHLCNSEMLVSEFIPPIFKDYVIFLETTDKRSVWGLNT